MEIRKSGPGLIWLRSIVERFNMKIGSVIDVNINGEYRPCIILSNTTYYDLYHKWLSTNQYLREYFIPYNLGLFISKNNYCSTDLQGYVSNNPVCHELLYGDKRVWVRSDQLLKHSRKV